MFALSCVFFCPLEDITQWNYPHTAMFTADPRDDALPLPACLPEWSCVMAARVEAGDPPPGRRPVYQVDAASFTFLHQYAIKGRPVRNVAQLVLGSPFS